jgi:hypothetical protein
MESLMERMNHITEELKAKDILLERAKIQATRVRGPPSLTTYEDEDVYMADSERNKLREERTINNAMRKRNARQVEDEEEKMDSDKGKARQVENEDNAMRKGKARQVEDEDEKMESSDKGKARQVENEDNAMRKGKGKARQVEDEDEKKESSDMESSDTESSDASEIDAYDNEDKSNNGESDVNSDQYEVVSETEEVRPIYYN